MTITPLKKMDISNKKIVIKRTQKPQEHQEDHFFDNDFSFMEGPSFPDKH